MRKPTDGQLAIGALIAFALWIFVALPLYYGPRDNSAAYKCSAKEIENYSFWEKARCDPVAYFTAWLVGFTGVLAVSTIGLWIVTWRSGVRQSRDMAASIAETRRIGEAQVRAYVDITQVRLILLMPQVVGASETTLIRIFAKNTGQSPARNLLWHPSIQFIGSARPGIAAEQRLGANWREMSGVGIAAGQEHDDGAMLERVPLRDEQPTISAVIRVRIDFEFDDVFGGHHAGETYFAGVFQRKIMGFDQTDLGPTRWEGTLRRTNTLRDWDSIAKTDRA